MRSMLAFAMAVLLSLGSHAAAAQAPAAPAPAQTPATTTATTPAAGVTRDDYVLGITDKIRVIVFNEPTLSGEFLVNSDGNLSLPLIGQVNARGRSTGDVREEIVRRLGDGYLREPRVSIDILSFRPYYILGEVTKPGEYPYANGMTVLNAVATAQGFTYRANKKMVFVKRSGTTEEQRQRLTADLAVQPGDTIRIGERYF